ncbi:MAG: hypothetical protein ACKOU7_11520, partial [Ferruginibacter sp.]
MDYDPAGIPVKKIMVLLHIWKILPLLFLSCSEHRGKPVNQAGINNTVGINPYKQVQAIPLPEGFQRKQAAAGSFTAYLRNIELKAQTT